MTSCRVVLFSGWSVGQLQALLILTCFAFTAPTAEAASGQPIRVLALGTSLTANYQWAEKLGEQLATCFVQEVSVENAAVAGANSSAALKQFASRQTLAPSIVLIEFSVNDADLIKGVGYRQSLLNHKKLISRIREQSSGSSIVLMTMSPVFGVRAWLRYGLGAYYDMYRDLADKESIEFVDLHSAWISALANQNPWDLFPDGLHPTAAAADQVILPVLQAKLFQLLQTR